MIPEKLEDIFKRGVRWSLTGSIGGTLLLMVQAVVFARLAGPSEAGRYALAATVIAFLSPMAEAGLGQAVVQARKVEPEQVAVLGWVNFGIGAILFALLGISAPYIAQWMGQPSVMGLLLIMGFSLFFTPFGAQYGGLMVRHLQFKAAATIELYSSLLGVITTCLLAVQGWGAGAMAMGYLVKNMLATAGAWWIGRELMDIPWWRPGKLADAVHFIRLGLMDLSARWVDAGANYADKIVVGKWLGVTALGFYNQAFGLYLLPVTRIGSVVGRVAFPVVARLQDDSEGLRAFYERTSRQLMWLLVPIYGVMALFSEWIIVLLYGEAWLPAAGALRLFSLAGLLRTGPVLLPHFLRGIGKPQLQMTYLLCRTVAVNVILGVVLYVYPDLFHAALAWAVAEVLVGNGLAVWIRKRTRFF